MTRRLISSGSPLEALAGYSRAVVQGDWCFVAGTTGYDYATMTMPEDAGDQARNALATIERTLVEAGFTLSDIVRATYYCSSSDWWPDVASVLGEVMRDIRPAATALVCGLVAPEMKIEIEVTAYNG